jgi:uncharacterized membrane protein
VSVPLGETPPVLRRAGERPALARALGCHARAERCFRVRGRPLPLCARCCGFLIGYAAAAAVLPFVALPLSAAAAAVAAALLAPGVVDGAAQALTPYRSTNARRIATGVAAGAGQILLLAHLAEAAAQLVR